MFLCIVVKQRSTAQQRFNIDGCKDECELTSKEDF